MKTPTERKPNPILETFRERFLKTAESVTCLNREYRGFTRQIRNTLHLRKDSSAQRWVEGTSMISISNLLHSELQSMGCTSSWIAVLDCGLGSATRH